MSVRNKTKKQYIDSLNQIDGVFDRHIVFSFKYFTSDDGQSFEDWERENILSDLNNKLKNFSSKSKIELLRDKTLEIYEAYPKGSKFSQPKNLMFSGIKWARFRVTGQRRLIGFFLDENILVNTEKADVFFVVFLDKNHLFAPSSSL